MSLCGRQGGLERCPSGGRARAMGGGRVRVGGVGGDRWVGGYRGIIGLNSPVYLMTLDRLTERS